MTAGSRPNRFDVSGKPASVTCSSRGLGNALARGLAGAGANVVLHHHVPRRCSCRYDQK